MVEHRFVAKDGTEVLFRELRRGDERQLMRFINRFVDEPRSGLLIDRKLSLKAEKEWLESRLSEVRSRLAVDLALEHEGRIMGNCDINRMPWKHSHRGMMGVAIAKELRGKGVGKALMRRTIELAITRIKGLESIELSAFSYNKRAISLYHSLGFSEIARIPRSAKEDGEYFDEIILAKRLR